MSATTTLEQPKAQPEPSKSNDGGSLKAYLGQNIQQYGMIAVLLLIIAAFQWSTDGLMLNPDNIAALIQQNAYVFVLTIGMVMVIVAGHIDLSVGSVVAFVGGICAVMITDFELSWPVAVAISIVIGGLVGCWQGFWVAYAGIPAFIVTLGGMLLFRGLAIVVLEQTIAGLPSGFNDISNGSLPAAGYVGNLDAVTLFIGVFAFAGLTIAQIRARRELTKLDLRTEPFAAFAGKLVLSALAIGAITYLLASSAGGTPIVLVIVGVLVLIYTFLMNNTIFGRHIYAMGGNLPAAMLSGVKTKRVNFLIFVNMGLLAGVAAVITTSRAGAGIAAAGTNYELDAIAAAFIGGTSVNGGIGKITGAITGALIMGVLNMGLSIMGTDPAYQQVIKGLVLIAAVALDILNKRRGK
ncbi:putative multiple sugar transport system permease protein [Actinoplanes campanulatus]|uniref:Xylose transport system permease protein XylH n=1 Tax=Actinoplanes campanulatus TaxID=113559 RepID=A0A7W5AKX1_9ACTN|nr:multiple monosaccharide ABC transporter permease [Actinoplanes campanulatus]MBB3098010.1 putative multiple sugar transport system permease protein [Actinoplanes campanulatus]GGN31907.1 ABC transporter permease [Actinoplanes campanulatus]GID41397.1 ABC transporter permease [Actinoplanes campanulatus]